MQNLDIMPHGYAYTYTFVRLPLCVQLQNLLDIFRPVFTSFFTRHDEAFVYTFHVVFPPEIHDDILV